MLKIRQWLSKISWFQALVCFFVILVSGRLLFRRWPDLPIRWILASMFLALKYYVDWPETRSRLGRANNATFMRKLILILPPIFPAVIQINRATFTNFLKWLRRSPVAGLTVNGEKFQFLEKGQYGTALIIFFLAMLVEIPFSALLISLIGHNPAQNFRVHMSLLAITAYAIIWVLADRWALKASSHALTTEFLHLRLGERISADIPTRKIVNAELMNEPTRLWCVRNGKSSLDTLVVSPIDAPNLVLTLEAEASVEINCFKTRRQAPAYLFLYVDDPRRLIARLAPTKR